MRYAANIERALSSWEISPEEWADYIAFLARLLKAIQSHRKDHVSELPHSDAIATRLAQCLNPALPSGVHQKALEVYTYIFSTFGNDHIASHIHEYLPGLTAVLSFASLSVRPGLYSLFEDHIVNLSQSALRPALKSLILSLLPALEDETGEDFERAFAILQTFERSFTPDVRSVDLGHDQDGYFWQCLFLSVITSASRRQGALNYLTRTLPKLTAKDVSTDTNQRAADCVVSPEPGLLLRCFICGLSDPQILIQRGFLDLLVTHLPLNSQVLQEKVGDEDLDRLVSAAMLVLLRRDMSLNRRLWSWFLGPEPKDQPESRSPSPNVQRKLSNSGNADLQLRYFSANGKASLERCVLKMLQNSSKEPSQRARPFRICLSLMDRWEIGGLLVSQIFLPAMRSLYEYSLTASSNDVAEVIRSASLFFDGVEASLIWECLLGILSNAFERKSDIDQSVKLFRWIIQTFNVRDEEMLNLHIPQAILFILSAVNTDDTPMQVRQVLLDAATLLLNMVPSRVFRAPKEKSGGENSLQVEKKSSGKDAQRAVMDYYHAGEQATGRTASPFSNQTIAKFLAIDVVEIIAKSLSALDSELYPMSTTFLAVLLEKAQLQHGFEQPLKTALFDGFGSTDSRAAPFPILYSTVGLFSALTTGDEYLSAEDVIGLEPALMSQLWAYMSPDMPKYHVEAVKVFWQLENMVGNDDSTIASLSGLVRSMPPRTTPAMSMAQERPPTTPHVERVETVRRFAVLWNHSIALTSSKTGGSIRRASAMAVLPDSKTMQRNLAVLEHPLMLVLDCLENVRGDPTSGVVRSWLQGLASLEQVFQILFRQLKACITSSSSGANQSTQKGSQTLQKQPVSQRERSSRVREMDYIFSHVHNILVERNTWTWACLSTTFVLSAAKTNEPDGLQFLAKTCVHFLCSNHHSSEAMNKHLIQILNLLLSGPTADELKPLELDSALLDRLMDCISGNMSQLQGGILTLVKLALRLRLSNALPEPPPEQNRPRTSLSLKSTSIARSPSASTQSLVLTPPSQLFKCLQMGFSASNSRYYLDQWLAFLADILPNFADALFSNLLPLVECLCEELAETHAQLVATTHKGSLQNTSAPEPIIMSLLEGLEMLLDRAYECLLVESADQPAAKEIEAKPNFFSHVAAGMFKAEGPPSKTAQANSRLTVILTFQDAIRVALKMWLWASNASDAVEFDISSSATTAYNALKVRNKSRHLLEQIFSVEPLESLEVIVAHWSGAETDGEASAALSLLHVMPVSRPKHVVPAILDSLCSRTNPSALPPNRQSSVTLDISSSDVATFLSAYLASIEDDAMDEVWSDCITFLRDVLSNPLPFRQVLPHLLAVILLLAEKLSNTNFGEQRKMRRDLGDIFQRLLTATFTTLPSGYVTEPALEDTPQNGIAHSRHATTEHSMTLLPVLIRVTAKIDLILESPERITTAINNITASLISSIFRARSFPKNTGIDVLTLLANMTRKAPGVRPWKKEVADAFNDPKLLSSNPEILTQGWFPVLHQWSLHDKDRGMSELLTRLTPPSSAGIMFGVGASAARLEADRRTQLNLRRISILLLASPEDTYVAHLRTLEEKLAELFEASVSSSPSATIKAELFILCRALAVSVSAVHIAPLWPIINEQMQKALRSMLVESEESSEKKDEFGNLALLQCCKLLDVLIGLGLDEFLLHEWLYVTDTVDAVYAPDGWRSGALADMVGHEVGDDGEIVVQSTSGKLGMLLSELAVDKDDIKALPREEFVRAVLRPFLSQLSIGAYEGVYGMERVDLEGVRKEVLGDLLELGTVVE